MMNEYMICGDMRKEMHDLKVNKLFLSCAVSDGTFQFHSAESCGDLWEPWKQRRDSASRLYIIVNELLDS